MVSLGQQPRWTCRVALRVLVAVGVAYQIWQTQKVSSFVYAANLRGHNGSCRLMTVPDCIRRFRNTEYRRQRSESKVARRFAVDEGVMLAVVVGACAGVLWLGQAGSQPGAAEEDPSLAKLAMPPDGCEFADWVAISTGGADKLAGAQQQWRQDHGDMFCLRNTPLGACYVCVGSGPLARRVLANQNKMYKEGYAFSRTLSLAAATRETIGPSLTGMVGEEWRWRKVALSPVFTKQALTEPRRRVLNYVLRLADELRNSLGAAADTAAQVRIDDVFTEKAVRVIMFVMFGRELDFEPLEFGRACTKLMDYLLFSIITPGPLRGLPLPEFEAKRKAKSEGWETFDTVTLPEIRRIRDELAGERDSLDRGADSMVAQMIRGPWADLDDETITAECRVLLNAGFETTAHSLAFACGLFAANPEAASRVACEALHAHQGGWKDLNEQGLERLLDGAPAGAFAESLRLFPLAAALGGEAVRSFELEGYRIPKGARLQFLNCAIHNHPVEVGPDASTFDPWRWLDINGSGREPPVLMSFNLGAHACLGQQLAKLEGAVFLAAVARDFELSFPSGAPQSVLMEPGTFLQKPLDGMPLVVRRRSP